MMKMQHKLGLLLGAAIIAGCNSAPQAPDDATDAAPAMPVVKERPAPNPTKNAYFGDTHVHTKNSFDAFIVGTRTNADDAYRFAKGEAIDNGAGKRIKLDGPPLDFYAVTDHGAYMGVIAEMARRGSDLSKTKTAKSIFGLNANSLERRRESFLEIGITIVTGDEIEDIYDRDFIDSAWGQNRAAAEKHNDPGFFTTFAGYEFTAMEIIGNVEDNLGAINLHRNVIFEDEAPNRLFSTLDSPNPEDLWEWMNKQRAAGLDALAIPHNSNGSNGEMFDIAQTDGSAFNFAYAENRMLNEPIIEMTQIKGTSETHPGLSPNDDWADFELYDILIGMPVKSKVTDGSYARTALSRGLDIESEIGANPYAFGFIGASDTHVSAPSLSEENHFGKFANDLDLNVRGSIPPKGAKTWDADAEVVEDIIAAPQYGASGLAGVWATENTREALFAGMRSKEVFATSGPRIRVRLFASNDYEASMMDTSDMIETAYAKGVPMGSNITGGETSPSFMAWATQDANGMALQRLQVIKVWSENGISKEAIYDAACASGTPDPTTHRCADNGASVDVSTCATSGNGAAQLSTLWTDPDYVAGQKTAYYVRVLENPKCRWSTWDAVRNGTPPNPNMHATLQDRAWSSPIWVKNGD